jgi:spoIIIJ-associated protein
VKYLVPAANEDELRERLEAMDLNLDEVKFRFLETDEANGFGKNEQVALIEELAPDRTARLTRRLLYMLGFRARVRVAEYEDLVSIEIEGEDLAPMIGARGKTLEAFEVLLGAIVNKNAVEKKRVRLDISGYRRRREEKLRETALKAAQTAKRERREVSLEPMPAYERRIVHMAVQEVPGVSSRSEGTEPERHVIIFPA